MKNEKEIKNEKEFSLSCFGVVIIVLIEQSDERKAWISISAKQPATFVFYFKDLQNLPLKKNANYTPLAV